MSTYELLDELEAGELSVQYEGEEPQALLEWAIAEFSPRLAISAAFVIEEGFAVAELRAIVDDMAAAASAAGVEVVTGCAGLESGGPPSLNLWNHYLSKEFPCKIRMSKNLDIKIRT